MDEKSKTGWRDEFLTILKGGSPGDDLKKWLGHCNGGLPFLNLAAKIPAGPLPWHGGSTLDHMARCMNETAGDWVAVWFALCHDAGKLTTPANILPHHYGHETRGASLAAIWAGMLDLPGDMARGAAMTAEQHMKAGRFFILRPGKQLSLLEEVEQSPHAASFWKVVDADTKSNISSFIRPQWREVLKARERGMRREDQILLVKHLSSAFSR